MTTELIVAIVIALVGFCGVMISVFALVRMQNILISKTLHRQWEDGFTGDVDDPDHDLLGSSNFDPLSDASKLSAYMLRRQALLIQMIVAKSYNLDLTDIEEDLVDDDELPILNDPVVSDMIQKRQRAITREGSSAEGKQGKPAGKTTTAASKP